MHPLSQKNLIYELHLQLLGVSNNWSAVQFRERDWNILGVTKRRFRD